MTQNDKSASKGNAPEVFTTNQARLGEKILIDFGQPLKHFQHGYGRAVAAQDSSSGRKLVAYLSPAYALPRTGAVSNYKYAAHNQLLPLVSSGPVIEPKSGQEYYSFVFERPQAEPVLSDWKSKPVGISHDALIDSVIYPLLDVLKGFHKEYFIHGAMTLRNLYFIGEGGDRQVMLGECLSAAASKEMPALYEPIERSMAQPSGRGIGTIKDDLYSFGICIAMLAWGVNPMQSMSDAEIIQKKIEKGTYGLLAGSARLPPVLTEFLRGVLNDDESQRWGVSDIDNWVEGRRLSPRQPPVQLKAARGFEFEGHSYSYLKSLVQAITAAGGEKAADIFGGTDFQSWFTRNFPDPNLRTNFESAIERNNATPAGNKHKERFASEMAIALDPEGPIRFKTLSFLLHGLGYALADAIAHKRDIQDYAQAIKYQLPGLWLSMQYNMPSDAQQIASDLERCRQYLNQKTQGSGVERVTYMLCPDAPCLSPQFAKDFVHSSAQLLRVLERKAEQGTLRDPIFDRHIVAFLSVRHSKRIDPHMGLVNAQQKSSQLLGTLKTLAAIQKVEGIGGVPAICDYLIDKAAPIINQIYNATLREETSKKIAALKGSGDLQALLAILSDEQKMADDVNNFHAARREYETLEARKQMIAGTSVRKKEMGAQKGRQVAMLTAAVLSSIGILVHIVIFFTG